MKLRTVLCLWLVLSYGCGGAKSPPVERADDQSPASALTKSQIQQHNRGVGLMGRFEYGQAHDVFAELAKHNPELPAVRIDWAIATLNRQQPGDAEAAAHILDQVLAETPQDERAAYCRAILHLNGGDPGAALALFQQVAESDPTDGYAAYYVGQCLLDLSRAEDALVQFKRAQRIDGYLRSAYYGAFQAAQRSGDIEEAQRQLEQFQRLQDNPQARLAEIKYTRMGPKATVQAIGNATPSFVSAPLTDVFEPAAPLPIQDVDRDLWIVDSVVRPSITFCDIDGDRRVDLLIASSVRVAGQAGNAVLLNRGRTYVLQLGHPLARVAGVKATLWGDYDNDGLTDVYFCRSGRNQLWRQSALGQWTDVTASTGTSGNDFDTTDGAMFDADHDGDLDIFLVNQDGPNDLLSNNLDGTFRSIGSQQSIDGGGTPSVGLCLADFDHDRDVDLLVVNRLPPHEVYLNDRLWAYHVSDSFADLCNSPISSAIAGDVDCDGRVEIYTAGENGLQRWSPNAKGRWSGTACGPPRATGLSGPLALLDVNGNGKLDMICAAPKGWRTFNLSGATATMFTGQAAEGTVWAPGVLQPGSGPVVVGVRPGEPPLIWNRGKSGNKFLELVFSGREDKADQMRSNASGIGVTGAVRVGGRFTSFGTYRSHSGPGQSLQPLAVGLGRASQLDFVSINWPDGVFQSEMSLQAGETHRVEETQRQLSSCPVLFAWDGHAFQFVTDILGGGGIGFNLGRGDYSVPRPCENIVLPRAALRPKDGRLSLKISEPMEEICYLDAIRLTAYHLPPGWNIGLDERFAVGGPAPTGEPFFYRRSIPVSHATNDLGQDVTERVRLADYRAVQPGVRDARFIGRTSRHQLTLEFDRPLDEMGDDLRLVFDGWIEYPYSQTMFAAWQAGAAYEAPSLEAMGSDRLWKVMLAEFGYMAGMPRQASVPLDVSQLPTGANRLRLTTNQEIYWDRVFIAVSEVCPGAAKHQLNLALAEVCESGFACRVDHPQRRPQYDYARRVPLWDARHPAGRYTKFGAMMPLVEGEDDAVAIIGPGEEMHFEFDDLPDLGATRDGWTLHYLLETRGWCKDMDLFTKDGETVAPLPSRSTKSSSEHRSLREQLHATFNTRYRSG